MFAYFQQRRERFHWAEQLKQTYATEILRVRLDEYPRLGALLMNLGRYYAKKLSAEDTRKLAREINAWAYVSLIVTWGSLILTIL